MVNDALAQGEFACVYLTDPDYLGNRADVRGIAEVCRRHGVLLAVDAAHGAYLHFLPEPSHPTDRGADLVCASAHKTLPVLTGGAYLHVRGSLGVEPSFVREAMGLFGSTSPSYLILQSLDLCNRYLDTLPEKLRGFLPRTEEVRGALTAARWELTGEEPLKLTLCPLSRGYTGTELSALLAADGVFCEYADRTYLTLMVTPENSAEDLRKVRDLLVSLPIRLPIPDDAPRVHRARQALSLRQALFAPRETLPVTQCEGRVLAGFAAVCPPAVPIVQCGEVIDAEAVRALLYYGVSECSVVS